MSVLEKLFHRTRPSEEPVLETSAIDEASAGAAPAIVAADDV